MNITPSALALLAKMATGENGRRTGELVNAGFIEITLTDAGRAMATEYGRGACAVAACRFLSRLFCRAVINGAIASVEGKVEQAELSRALFDAIADALELAGFDPIYAPHGTIVVDI